MGPSPIFLECPVVSKDVISIFKCHRKYLFYINGDWDDFPAFIDKDHWPPNSPDLNPLDYCIWDEFVKVIDWNKVTSKPTLIQELKRAVKKIRQNIVFESCASWTNRLYRMSQNGGNYLR